MSKYRGKGVQRAALRDDHAPGETYPKIQDSAYGGSAQWGEHRRVRLGAQGRDYPPR
jgi:hypothetical protein